MATTININSITPGTVVYVNGVADFSRIKDQIAGEELAADNARKISKGMRAIDKPHTRFTISHASVQYADPAAPNIAEQYISEKFYKSKIHPEKDNCYTGMNRSSRLPEVYTRKSISSMELTPIEKKGELAPGQSVTLMLRFFATNMNTGVSLDAVIVNGEPVRWSNGSNTENALSARGFTINESATVEEVIEDLKPAYEQPAAQPVAPQTAAYAQPVPSAIPAAQPAAPAQATSSLPIPPNGYMYDATGRLVPISQTGGIKL